MYIELVKSAAEDAIFLGCLDREEVGLDSRLIHDLGFDSLDHIEFVMAIEEFCDLEIPDAESFEWLTVQDAVNTVHRMINEEGQNISDD